MIAPNSITVKGNTSSSVSARGNAIAIVANKFTFEVGGPRDHELVTRIAKAFAHMARLCGGEDEPF